MRSCKFQTRRWKCRSWKCTTDFRRPLKTPSLSANSPCSLSFRGLEIFRSTEIRTPASHGSRATPGATFKQTDFASVRRVRRGGGSCGVPGVASAALSAVSDWSSLLFAISSGCACMMLWLTSSSTEKLHSSRSLQSTAPGECHSSAVVSSVTARCLNAACRSRSPRWLGADGQETWTDSDARRPSGRRTLWVHDYPLII